ncbi:2-oxoglutarate and iron-dependent oxygenase domain-containing protein [Acuticoccus sp. MNP-M23]|uniref:isopenicillin N synthase family dioxygenase n=1 Tax=Acuticoccus sp. MNP-M23 TaxID=3072793 RepID=UPI002816362A|nr:2-oxoglutarate and iron-dependent oxygenase domain-containing protein [Acuticoccus sp. MNP-M23]WMS44691.1 2-oxoglutarate and iron-dependent oxygenase domain-containing protein [Acuticoccus sp. MNP-M23]
MAYAAAKTFEADLIPVVDISPLREGGDAHAVAAALHKASTGLGFIYITGHGIADATIDAARDAAYAFFRADGADKEAVRISNSHRGWLSAGGARMADGAQPDLKESFIFGYQNEAGDTPDDHVLRGANQWPAVPPQMEAASMAYFEAASTVAHHLMRGFALGLGLAEDTFLKTSDKPLSRASYVYYPAQPADAGEGQFGVGPHTDFGVLTVLCQDNVGGLQVQTVDGEWVHAPPIPGTLIVNVADLLSRWTAGAYVSTPHRVVNASGGERLSLVLAYDPNPATLIDPGPIVGDVPGAEPPITCGDYLVWRFERAFAYRKG